MNELKNVLRLGLCILIVMAFIGCAVPVSKSSQSEIYHPGLPAGITTIDAAIADLSGFLEQGAYSFGLSFNREYFNKRKMDYFVGTPSPSFQREMTESSILKGKISFYETFLSIDTEWMELQDDMLEASFRLFVLYAELPGLPITVKRYESGGGKISLGDMVDISGVWNEDVNILQRIADDLFFIQQNYQKYSDAKMALFEKRAAQYRSLVNKPAVSEELRKYIVQANAAAKNKEHGVAIRQYRDAVALDPVSYPAAYFNMALLSAQGKRYEPAIRYMKQYLMLVPDAPDARDAQDKIYEWEFMAQQ